MGKMAVAIDLTDSESGANWGAWRRGVGPRRVWPNGRGSFCWRRKAWKIRTSASESALRPTPSASGGGASRSVVWRASWTSPSGRAAPDRR
jgi:hypothetical protein